MSVAIWDFWNPKDKDHTLHTGDAWPGEERQNVQFYAFSQAFPGAEPIFDFWNDKDKEHTFHTGDAWPGEVKGSCHFFAFKEQKPGTQPVYDFWHSGCNEHTFHFGDPWPEEKKGSIQFYAYPNQLVWNGATSCDGPSADDRAKWLRDNAGLSEDAAKQQVMCEFAPLFGPVGYSDGGHFVDGTFPHTLKIVKDTHGRNRLQISIKPKDPGAVSLVAVHYGINDQGETMNFDIRYPDGDTYVHTTPDFGPLCNPGDKVTYWIAGIVRGLIQEMPEGACPNPDARLYWTAK